MLLTQDAGTSNEIIEVLLLAIHPSTTIPSLFGLRSRASRIECRPASISITIIPVIRNFNEVYASSRI